MKQKREHGLEESMSPAASARPAAGKRSMVARTYGLAAGRMPAESSPGGDRKLVGPGWGSFMPRLDPIDQQPEEAERGGDEAPVPDEREANQTEADAAAGAEAGDSAPDETEAGDAEAGDAEPGRADANGAEEGADGAAGEEDREEGGEEDRDGDGAAGGEAPEPALAAETAAVDAAEVAPIEGAQEEEVDDGEEGRGLDREDTASASADDGDARDDSGAGDAHLASARGGGRSLASVGVGASRGGARATAARLGPIDPPIPRPPRRRRRPFVSLLGGRGWRRVGLPGVRLKKAGPVAILAIDRTNSKVSLDTTKARGPFSLKNQARRQRADIALNGDLFNFATGKPSGLHRRHGKTLRGTSRKPWIGMFAFGRGRAGILSGKDRLPSWARNVVSGRPVILRNNRVVRRYSPADAPRLNQVNGRSAVGLSRSGRVLFLAASSGSTTRQMARLLKRSGADDALALDGSGSAQMYVKGRMVKRGDGRKIGNAILVRTD